jgi:hypothetical protein
MQVALEGTADLLENLPAEAYVKLTRHLLSTASTFPTEETPPIAVLKTGFLYTS